MKHENVPRKYLVEPMVEGEGKEVAAVDVEVVKEMGDGTAVQEAVAVKWEGMAALEEFEGAWVWMGAQRAGKLLVSHRKVRKLLWPPE